LIGLTIRKPGLTDAKTHQKPVGLSDIIAVINRKNERVQMNTSIVLTILGDDHPGIVQTVSSVLQKHGGSWTHSSMGSLAGQFAGILLVSIPDENTIACQRELQALESQGLRIISHISKQPVDSEETNVFVLDLVGNDRHGIVHDITTVLSRHNVNVHSLETLVEAASMGGGELFRARAELVVPVSTDIDILESELEDIANDLMVDINLEK
jgi:glycine cleavage system regulatory protein